MKRKFWIYILLTILIIPTNVEAQRWKLKRYEATFGLGSSLAYMDIGKPDNDFHAFQFVSSRPVGVFKAAYKITDVLTAGLDLSYIRFGGVDVENRLPVYSFSSNALEHVAVIRYSFIANGQAFGSSALFNRKGMVNNYNSSDFYVFAGAGGIVSKSKVYDENHEIIIDDHFHNNNLDYGLVFPMGLGFKYTIDSDWAFGFEIGGRFALTDLIDGYATPYSQYKDKYVITNFSAIYKIRNNRRGLPIFSKYGR